MIESCLGLDTEIEKLEPIFSKTEISEEEKRFIKISKKCDEASKSAEEK